MKLLLILLSSLMTAGILAETRYVSDSLTIFFRTGPSHEFRIIGTLDAGQAADIIEDNIESKATKIRLASGREVWVDTDQLMTDKPSGLLLKEVKLELQQLRSGSKQQITTLKQDLSRAKELASHSENLQKQVAQLEYDKELLEQKNQSLSERSRYDLLTAGGVVALVGLLLGLILPHFINRKRNDVWR